MKRLLALLLCLVMALSLVPAAAAEEIEIVEIEEEPIEIVEAKNFRNGYQYRCKVTNAAGYKYSSAATLTVK